MWWEETIKEEGNATFAIETSHYDLSFDYLNLSIERFAGTDPWNLRFGLETDGEVNWCTETSGDIDDCQLVETGKYFQRRFINNLPGLKGCKPYDSGLEISSWPDRVSFILKAVPESDLRESGLHMDLAFPSKYSVLLEKGNVKALKNPNDGSGFIILKSKEATEILVKDSTVQIALVASGKWAAGKDMNAGIILYPLEGSVEARLEEIAGQELNPLQVKAKQIAPSNKRLDVKYDMDHGWHQVKLRSDDASSNDRMERVEISVSNPSDFDRILRLNFAKGRLIPDGANVPAITGISAVFRDMDGNPTGIPVQVSKNWHGGSRSGRVQYFRGSWYHGLSMLTIPAKTNVEFEYTSVNAHWGGVPAASHAQLCLIGWGSNQQWDESAIGAWGNRLPMNRIWTRRGRRYSTFGLCS